MELTWCYGGATGQRCSVAAIVFVVRFPYTHSETTALWIPPKPGLLVSSCSNITGHGFTGDWTHAILRSKTMYHFKAVKFYFLPSATWLLLRLSHRDAFLTPIGAWVTLMRERKPGIPTRRWQWWSLAWVMPSSKGAWGKSCKHVFGLGIWRCIVKQYHSSRCKYVKWLRWAFHNLGGSGVCFNIVSLHITQTSYTFQKWSPCGNDFGFMFWMWSLHSQEWKAIFGGWFWI